MNERFEVPQCGLEMASGDLLSVTDPKGNKVSYTYDPSCNGLVRSQTDSRGTTYYDYEGAGHLATVTDALGHVTSYTYDASGNQKTETRSRIVDGAVQTLVTSYEYDGNGQRTKVTYPDGTFTRHCLQRAGEAEVHVRSARQGDEVHLRRPGPADHHDVSGPDDFVDDL